MRLRLRDRDALPRRKSYPKSNPSHPHIQRMVERMGEGRQSGLTRMGPIVNDVQINNDRKGSEDTTGDVIIDIKKT